MALDYRRQESLPSSEEDKDLNVVVRAVLARSESQKNALFMIAVQARASMTDEDTVIIVQWPRRQRLEGYA